VSTGVALFVVFEVVVGTGVGYGIGRRRGRPAAGAVLGLLLGVLGWLVIVIVPRRATAKADVWDQVEPGALAVELVAVTKRFPGVVANDGVELRVRAGTIHAIVGENGAGKSTLMNILYGIIRPDAGEIRVAGRTVNFRSAKDAIDVGIGMVHQHFKLADNLTVLENVVLGGEPVKGAVFLDEAGARRRILELGKRYGLGVDPDALVEVLGVGARQRVEILKVLYRGARILIMDEPTAVLVPQEVEELLRSLRELTHEGVTVLLIDHKLDEVLGSADEVTVIRAGRTVATVAASEVDSRELAELMVGSELPTPGVRTTRPGDEVVFHVAGLGVEEHGRTVLSDIELSVHRAEVVGIAGVEGNGQHELIEALMGVRTLSAGRVVLNDDDITDDRTRARRRDGIGLIPQDRHREALLLDAPLWENAVLGHQSSPPYARGFWIDKRAARRRTAGIVKAFDVRTPSVDVSAHALSGGNQQKLIIGKEMVPGPKLLIAAHPTRGIDVGAQAAVWEQLRAARDAGLGVLLISADLEELLGLSDVVHVMLRGRIVATVDPATVTPEELGSYMTGAKGSAPPDDGMAHAVAQASDEGER
jgi:general nucleoside transport system ATP-binding protein